MFEMTDRFASDNCLLIPCRREGCDENSKEFKHSVSGGFEVENSPLRINTILFVGSKNRLKTHLKSKIDVDISKDNEFSEAFKGVSGLTFPCNDSDGVNYVVIWMPRFEWSVTDMETLSHECLHAAVMVMRMSGVKAKIFSSKNETDVDDEELAYHQSSMLAQLLKELARKQQRAYKKMIKDSKKRSAV